MRLARSSVEEVLGRPLLGETATFIQIFGAVHAGAHGTWLTRWADDAPGRDYEVK